ncbi:MAG: succinylglutamate desuccinylase/aspartoacylase family protein [Armatimonadia bacterium]
MPTPTLAFANATLTDGSPCSVPYWHLDSGRPGEVFMVLAEQHGNEVQGCEVIRRFRGVCEAGLVRGQVYLIPFANPLALRHRRSHVTLGPEQPYGEADGQNMNLTWPGDPEGKDTSRVSHALWQAIGRRCTRCLDLHSWSRFTATCTLSRDDVPEALEMAMATSIRFVQGRPRPNPAPGQPSLVSVQFNNNGLAATCIELAPQWVIREKEVAQGLRAATNIAKLLGMLEGEIEPLEGPVVKFSQQNMADRVHKLCAPCSGLFVENGLETSDYVEEGQKLGHIISDETLATVEILSPTSGYLWEYGCHRTNCDVALPDMHPYASAGDPLASVMTV